MTMLSLLFCVFVALALAGSVAWWFLGIPALARKVAVKFRDPDAPGIVGVLWSRRGQWLVFKDVQIAGDDGKPTQLDGDVVIDRSQVLWLQRI